MVTKEKKTLLEKRKRILDTEIKDLQLDVVSSDQHALLTMEQRYLRALYEGDMKPVQKVLCIERHQSRNVAFLRTDTPACRWGQTRENASTCGDCPFGVELMEFVPKYDVKTVLKQLKREQEDNEKVYR